MDHRSNQHLKEGETGVHKAPSYPFEFVELCWVSFFFNFILMALNSPAVCRGAPNRGPEGGARRGHRE